MKRIYIPLIALLVLLSLMLGGVIALRLADWPDGTRDNPISEQYAAVRAAVNPAVAVIRPNASGTLELFLARGYALVTVTPTPTSGSPTVTIPPTNTPRTLTPSETPTATYTPSSTPTRRPTFTKTPTATDEIDDGPSPTDEVTIDPITDAPENPVCVAKVGNDPHIIRSDHLDSATRIGTVPRTVDVTVLSFYIYEDDRNEWIEVNYNGVHGWMRIGDNLVAGANGTEETCFDPAITKTVYASPTKTPVPTQAGPTPTALPPIVQGCEVYNPGTGTINIRNGPGKSYAVIDSFSPNEAGIALRVHVISTAEEWAYFSQLSTGGTSNYGYIALKINGSALAALRGQNCANVPRVQGDVRVGWHLTQGAQWGPLASTVRDYSAVKSTDLTAGVGQTFKQENSGALWVHRSIFGAEGAFNCPTFEWYSPQIWIERYRYTWPSSQYIETINECGIGPGGDTFNNFLIESTKYANKLGYCVLIGSWAAGTPDYPEWTALLPVLKWLDANPCRYENGKPIFNGIATHGAFCSGPGMMSNQWTSEPHICDRHMIVRNELFKATGYDLYNFRGPIVYSEFGIDAGYGGTSADPVWPTDKWLEVVGYTLDLFEREGLVDAIILWNLGDGGAGQWIDRVYWIEPLAALLRSRK